MKATSLPAVVLTGVSSGIGQATAIFLLEKGYQVFGSVRKKIDAERLHQEFGDVFYPLIFDITDRTALHIAYEQVLGELDGRILKAIINNAGISLFGPMEYLDDAHFEKIVGVNIFGSRNVINAFLPLLRSGNTTENKPGKIINISSLSGILNTPMIGAYCISKHAIESMGEIYRRELLPEGIDVVSIRPGPIQSEIWAKNTQTDTHYGNVSYQKMAKKVLSIMQKAEAGALPATVIAQLIQDILEGRRKKTAYEVGRGALISRILASSLMPKRFADRLIVRAVS